MKGVLWVVEVKRKEEDDSEYDFCDWFTTKKEALEQKTYFNLEPTSHKTRVVRYVRMSRIPNRREVKRLKQGCGIDG